MPYNNLTYDFFRLLFKYPFAERMIRNLSREGELFLFGGAVRSYLENKFTIMPRDFDIVIKTNGFAANIEECFKDLRYKKNRYGGYKISIDGLDFDIWQMQYTWAFRQHKIEMKEENLAMSVFLNIDSIAYSLNNNKYYDEVYKESMKTKILDIVLEDNPFVELNLLRALVFKRRYNMKLSERLRGCFLEYFYEKGNDFIIDLYNLQFSHYGEKYFSINEISHEINEISHEKMVIA